MKIIRYALWAVVFVLGAFLAFTTMTWTLNNQNGSNSLLQADVGGAFTAQLTSGQAITQDDMKGKPHVLFFGFTHCPDICPTTLYEATQLLKELGDDADKLDVYFITVDPARDTAEVLGEYLTAFDPRIKGVTGTQAQINDLVKKWRVFVQMSEKDEDGDYSVSHTSSTFLMNSDGQFKRTISYGENKDVALQKMRKLIEEDA